MGSVNTRNTPHMEKPNWTKFNEKWKQSPCSKPSSHKTCSKLLWKFVSELHLWLEANLLVTKYFIFGKTDSLLCSICHSNDETVAHLFCECVRVSQLWSQLRIFFSTDLNLLLLTPQAAIFGFLVETDKCIFKITNHLLLIFKMYICKSWEKSSVDVSSLINEIRKTKTHEKNIATNDTTKLVI